MRKLALVILMLMLPAVSFASSVQMLTGEQCASLYGGSGTCSDRARAFYGALGYSGTLYDMEYAYLSDLGYAGSWGDRWRQYLSGYGGGLQQKFREYGKAARGLTLYAPLHNPSNPLYLAKGTSALSFTRATTATYVHPTTGLITSAASGGIRIESSGALIEGARTNSVLYSNDISNEVWVARGTAAVSPDNTASPDGNVTADRLDGLKETGAAGDIYQLISGFTPAASYEPSFYMSRVSTSGSYMIANGTGATNGTWLVDLSVLGAGWEKITRYHPAVTVSYEWVADGGGNIYPIHSQWGSDVPIAVHIYNVQLESGPISTSPIPTEGTAVTRNADVLKVASLGHVDNVSSTVALEWSPLFASTMTTGAAYYMFDAGAVEAYYNATDQKVYLTDGTNTVASAALTFSANVAQKLAFRWGPSGLAIYRNGASAASGATYTSGATNEYLFIGTDTSSAGAAYSNIKTLKAWNRELSASEMGAITK